MTIPLWMPWGLPLSHQETTCIFLGALSQLLKGLASLFEIISPALDLNFEFGKFIQHVFIP